MWKEIKQHTFHLSFSYTFTAFFLAIYALMFSACCYIPDDEINWLVCIFFLCFWICLILKRELIGCWASVKPDSNAVKLNEYKKKRFWVKVSFHISSEYFQLPIKFLFLTIWKKKRYFARNWNRETVLSPNRQKNNEILMKEIPQKLTKSVQH